MTIKLILSRLLIRLLDDLLNINRKRSELISKFKFNVGLKMFLRKGLSDFYGDQAPRL